MLKLPCTLMLLTCKISTIFSIVISLIGGIFLVTKLFGLVLLLLTPPTLNFTITKLFTSVIMSSQRNSDYHSMISIDNNIKHVCISSNKLSIVHYTNTPADSSFLTFRYARSKRRVLAFSTWQRECIP